MCGVRQEWCVCCEAGVVWCEAGVVCVVRQEWCVL